MKPAARKTAKPAPAHDFSSGTMRRLAGWGVLAAAYFFAARFFTFPSILASEENPISRLGFLAWPLIDPGGFFTLWGADSFSAAGFFGRNIVPALFTGLALSLAGTAGLSIFRILKIKRPENTAEEIFLSLCTGFGTLTAVTAVFALSGAVHLWGKILLPAGTAAFFWTLCRSVRLFLRSKSGGPFSKGSLGSGSGLFVFWCGIFLLLIFFTATAPPMEYDMLEYHVQAAREIFDSGRYGFFPYNAYLNMPLGAEMLLLWGNAAAGWFFGGEEAFFYGICWGKTLSAAMTAVTALGLYALGCRFFHSRRFGLWAAFGYMTFPNLFQTATLGLNDALLGLANLAVFYTLMLIFTAEKSESIAGKSLLAGLFTGWAVSIKYTGVIFTALPALVFLQILLYRRFGFSKKGLIPAGYFFLAALGIGGIWYLKNALTTENPVWPLAYGIFGDSSGIWNEAVCRRWQMAHSSSDFGLSAMLERGTEFFLCGREASPLAFTAIPFIGAGLWTAVQQIRRKEPSKKSPESAVWLCAFSYTLLFAVLWFFATHRLIRFLDPVLPFAAILIGGGIFFTRRINRNRIFRAVVFFSLILCAGYSLVFDASSAPDLLAPAEKIAAAPNRYGEWAVRINSRSLPGIEPSGEKRLLLIGEARAGAYRVPVLYSTCWNRSPLVEALPETFLARHKKSPNDFSISPEEASQIRQSLTGRRIGFILVDYSEIDRFNSPGNYGLTDADLLRPELFSALEKAGILRRYVPPKETPFSEWTQRRTALYTVEAE